jgi:hypothetical protein
MARKQRDQSDNSAQPYDAGLYRGGRTKFDMNGYILEHAPHHPRSDQYGYVAQHRLVMERKLGRYLTRKEVVHHEDDDKANNHPDNLRLFACQADHMRHHRLQDALCYNLEVVEKVRQIAADPKAPLYSLGISPPTVQKICRMYGIEWKRANLADLTEEQVREALQGRTTEEAAIVLQVHPQTLYNRFDHLLDKRNSPGFLDEHREELCKIAIEKGISAAAEKFGTNRKTLYEAFERWGISGDFEYRGKRDLESRKEEVCDLIQKHGFVHATKMLGRSKNALREAVKRWSEQGGLPDGFVLPVSSRQRQKPQPERTDLGAASSSPQQALDLPAS